MEKNNIHWTKALELLKNNISVNQTDIEFDEIIHIHDVFEFNKNNIDVPEHLINYDDDNIDCSDIPEITNEDILSGKLVRVLTAKVKVDTETEKWIRKSKINYNELLSNLLNEFYQSIKILPNRAAL